MVVSQPWNRPNRLAYLRRSALADNDIDFAVLGGEMGRRKCACKSANMEIGAETHYPTPCMLLTTNTGVPEFGIQDYDIVVR